MSLVQEIVNIEVQTKSCILNILNVDFVFTPYLVENSNVACVKYKKAGEPDIIKTVDEIDSDVNFIIDSAKFFDAPLDLDLINAEIQQVKESANKLFTIASL